MAFRNSISFVEVLDAGVVAKSPWLRASFAIRLPCTFSAATSLSIRNGDSSVARSLPVHSSREKYISPKFEV